MDSAQLNVTQDEIFRIVGRLYIANKIQEDQLAHAMELVRERGRELEALRANLPPDEAAEPEPATEA